MTDMVNLIVPPIIVVFAVAILIVFLTKKLSSENFDEGNFILKKKKKDQKKKRIYARGATVQKHIAQALKKKKDASDFSAQGDFGKSAKITQGINLGSNGGKVVSLRKKSMVSDKIENAEGRDSAEIALMTEIEENPHNSKKYEKLGDYYMEHEKFEDARDCYKYVLRLDPRHKRAQVAMKNLDRVLE